MFDNDFFDKWLDKKSNELIDKISEGKTVTSEEMIILVLKAQSNHFHHLDKEIREEITILREDMDRRFEQVDKRFEQVDKRFEQVDKRFEDLVKRLDRFMFWSLGLVATSTFIIIKFLS
jgi:glucosamine 6-phosphate synthetase-like amidotransferase/phosphosugar isomerase protein